jgi:hypothetical protein
VSTPQFPGLGAGPNGPSGFPGTRGSNFPGLSDGPGNVPPSSDLGFPVAGEEPSGGSDRSGPPIGWFAGAVAAPVVSLPLLLLDGWGWHVLGWVVATFGTAALLIVATLQDTHRRASVWYLGQDGLVRGLRLGAVVLALVAAAAHAWLFADWFSRLAVFSS